MGAFQDILQEIPLSAVLRERVQLTEQKFELAERENATLKARIEALEAENQRLRAEPRGSFGPGAELDAATKDILIGMFRRSEGEDNYVEALAARHGLSRSVVQFHLDELKAGGFAHITHGNYVTGHTYWGLTPLGRKYVIQNKLV